MNIDTKARLDDLIKAQGDWIADLQAQQQELEKYRNGILPVDRQLIWPPAKVIVAGHPRMVSGRLTTPLRGDAN